MAERNNRKTRVGVVVSNKMQKSVVVKIQRQFIHPTYHRVIRRSNRLVAHDEKNECGIGDKIRIMETRPMSRTKRWRVLEIIEKAR